MTINVISLETNKTIKPPNLIHGNKKKKKRKENQQYRRETHWNRGTSSKLAGIEESREMKRDIGNEMRRRSPVLTATRDVDA